MLHVIRAFKDDRGITHLYNYTGDPVTTAPVYPLTKTWISNTVLRYTDNKKKDKAGVAE